MNPHAMPGERGFTLIEALLVIVVIGVLLALAAPSFITFTSGQKVKTASFELYSTFTYARSEALKRRADVTITAAGSDWKDGWTITSTTPAPNPSDPPISVTLRNQDPLSGVTMTPNPAGTLAVIYKANGRVVSGMSVLIQPQSGDLSAVNPNRCVQLGSTGLPKTTATDQVICP
jgi:type IV fimbrial biogenesis protein FimT